MVLPCWERGLLGGAGTLEACVGHELDGRLGENKGGGVCHMGLAPTSSPFSSFTCFLRPHPNLSLLDTCISRRIKFDFNKTGHPSQTHWN